MLRCDERARLGVVQRRAGEVPAGLLGDVALVARLPEQHFRVRRSVLKELREDMRKSSRADVLRRFSPGRVWEDRICSTNDCRACPNRETEGIH